MQMQMQVQVQSQVVVALKQRHKTTWQLSEEKGLVYVLQG